MLLRTLERRKSIHQERGDCVHHAVLRLSLWTAGPQPRPQSSSGIQVVWLSSPLHPQPSRAAQSKAARKRKGEKAQSSQARIHREPCLNFGSKRHCQRGLFQEWISLLFLLSHQSFSLLYHDFCGGGSRLESLLVCVLIKKRKTKLTAGVNSKTPMNFQLWLLEARRGVLLPSLGEQLLAWPGGEFCFSCFPVLAAGCLPGLLRAWFSQIWTHCCCFCLPLLQVCGQC